MLQFSSLGNAGYQTVEAREVTLKLVSKDHTEAVPSRGKKITRKLYVYIRAVKGTLRQPLAGNSAMQESQLESCDGRRN